MKIAVTGAGGLIGGAVAARLAGSREVVTVGRRAGNALVADFSDPAAVAALDLSGVDAVVHCAGIVDEDFAADRERAFRQATLGMAALVQVARAGGVGRLAYVSSAHVYGPLSGVLDETCAPNPLSDYAIAHFASEQIARRAAEGDLRCAVLRPCAVFGIPPRLDHFRRWALTPFAFPRDLAADGRIVLRSPGTQRRNFVGAEDIARCVETWLDQAAPAPFTAINPIGRETMPMWDFAHLCARAFREVTGRDAQVSRPSDGPADSFEYRTVDARYAGDADLYASIVRLTGLLAGEAGA